MPKVDSTRVRETPIVRACIECIRHFGGHAERTHSGTSRRGQYTLKHADEGCADILGVWHGRGLAVEVKVPGKNPRKNQMDWKVKWEEAGGRYLCVHSPKELRNELLGTKE